MRHHPVLWILRVTWVSLLFTLADSLNDVLADVAGPVRVVGTVLFWLLWVVVAVATVVAHPVSLTLLRLLTPLAPILAVATATALAPDAPSTGGTALAVVSIVAALIATACALSGVVADENVDAGSYGDERRFALATPLQFLAGPIPVFWVLLVPTAVSAPLAIADRRWALGAILAAVCLVVAKPAIAAFHALSRRWIVFVPAGVTLVDHVALADPVLMERRRVTALGPALAGGGGIDLSGSARGLALEAELASPVELARRTAGREAELTMASGVVFTPVRPGSVLAEARRRGLPVTPGRPRTGS
ncbi:MAG: hypothetical protein R2698_14340 [Microthrixaceae bacterium]